MFRRLLANRMSDSSGVPTAQAVALAVYPAQTGDRSRVAAVRTALSWTYRGMELRHWPACVWTRFTQCGRYGHYRGCSYLLACSNCAAPWLFDSDDDLCSPYR